MLANWVFPVPAARPAARSLSARCHHLYLVGRVVLQSGYYGARFRSIVGAIKDDDVAGVVRHEIVVADLVPDRVRSDGGAVVLRLDPAHQEHRGRIEVRLVFRRLGRPHRRRGRRFRRFSTLGSTTIFRNTDRHSYRVTATLPIDDLHDHGVGAVRFVSPSLTRIGGAAFRLEVQGRFSLYLSGLVVNVE